MTTTDRSAVILAALRAAPEGLRLHDIKIVPGLVAESGFDIARALRALQDQGLARWNRATWKWVAT